jgi:hypothetical protein
MHAPDCDDHPGHRCHTCSRCGTYTCASCERPSGICGACHQRALAGLPVLRRRGRVAIWALYLHVAVDALMVTRWARAQTGQPALSPGWMVAWWFIPLANLVMPYRGIRSLLEVTGGTEGCSRARVASRWTRCWSEGPLAGTRRSPGRCLDEYDEVQVHGELRLEEDVEAVVADPSFRGMPSLARRIAEAGRIHAHALGEAVAAVHREPAAWSDRGAPRRVLQELKWLWHVLVRFGRPAEPARAPASPSEATVPRRRGAPGDAAPGS